MNSCIVNKRLHEAISTGLDCGHLAEIKAFIRGNIKSMLRSTHIIIIK